MHVEAHSDDPPPIQPLPPEIFCGREDLLSSLVKIMTNNEQPRIAILGAGGMGKTSTALHLIHHKAVLARYNDRAFFVGCDALTSADALASRIMQIIGNAPAAGENPITALHLALKRAPPTALLLDNFESICEAEKDHGCTRDLLQKIADAPSAALVLTMRAAVPPPGIKWTFFESLPPISPPFAKEVFQAVNPAFRNCVENEDRILDDLLKEVDYIPLAIHLLAQVSFGFSAAFMLKRWREEKTEMLRLDEVTEDKHESLEVSISLSIRSLGVKQNPGAVQLLGMLCLLPDGLHRWEDRLDAIGKTLINGASAVTLLQRLALIQVTGATIRVLSPIRHFVLRCHPPDHAHAQCIYTIFWELVDTYAVIPFGPDFNTAVEALLPEIGNIGSLIEHCVALYPGHRMLEIAIQMSWHLSRTLSSANLLDKASKLVPAAAPILQANFWQISGEISFMQYRLPQAWDNITRARDLFLAAGDRLEAARCLNRLGGILRRRGQWTEAANTLNMARDEFLAITDHVGVAQCLIGLGDILRIQKKYPEAVAVLAEARDEWVKIGDRLGIAQCSYALGLTLHMQGQYPEAFSMLTKVRDELLSVGSRCDAAYCLLILADILSVQERYPEVMPMVRKALDEYVKIGDRRREASCSWLLGKILLAQSKTTDAKIPLNHARDIFLSLGMQKLVADCSRLLAECEVT